MTKKRGIISLLILVVLMAVGTYTALFGLDADKGVLSNHRKLTLECFAWNPHGRSLGVRSGNFNL